MKPDTITRISPTIVQGASWRDKSSALVDRSPAPSSRRSTRAIVPIDRASEAMWTISVRPYAHSWTFRKLLLASYMTNYLMICFGGTIDCFSIGSLASHHSSKAYGGSPGERSNEYR